MHNTVHQPKGTRGVRALRSLAFVLLLSTVSTGAAFAGPWQLGFALGSADLGGNGNDDLDFRGADLDFRGEVRVGRYLSDRFAVELQGMRASAILDASMSAWMVNGVFDLLPEARVVPYVLAGAGYARLADVKFFSTEPSITGDGPAYQAGIGAHFYFGEARRVAMRVELSSLWENTDIFDDERHTSLVTGVTWTLGN